MSESSRIDVRMEIERALQAQITSNANLIDNVTSTIRRNLGSEFSNPDPRRNVWSECGYPENITLDDYMVAFKRKDIANRIVSLWPNACWKKPPSVYETPEVDSTEFETAWDQLVVDHKIWSYLKLLDTMSGIGQFGVMLLGVSDGRPLDTPINNVTGTEVFSKVKEPVDKTTAPELMFLRVFDQTVVSVAEIENDPTNPRYGKPLFYHINFTEPSMLTSNVPTSTMGGATVGIVSSPALQPSVMPTRVHWTRIIHAADGMMTSSIYGTPRLEKTFNRVMDVEKILGGSAEMFWRGGFPGLAFEVNPDITEPMGEEWKEGVRKEFDQYVQSMTRYIAVQGISVKSLSPQVADPKNHLESHLNFIASSINVPLRILMGSEAGHLASTQDQVSFNDDVMGRCTDYCEPWILIPFIIRLIEIGILPKPEKILTAWPDLNTPTDEQRAKVGQLLVDALARYMQSGAQMVVPPSLLLTKFLGFDESTTKLIIDAATEQLDLGDEGDLTELITEHQDKKTNLGTQQDPNIKGASNDQLDNRMSQHSGAGKRSPDKA